MSIDHSLSIHKPSCFKKLYGKKYSLSDAGFWWLTTFLSLWPNIVLTPFWSQEIFKKVSSCLYLITYSKSLLNVASIAKNVVEKGNLVHFGKNINCLATVKKNRYIPRRLLNMIKAKLTYDPASPQLLWFDSKMFPTG